MTSEEWQIVWFTAWVSALSTLVITPFGLAIAWLLARREWPGKSIVETLVSLPLVMPPVATGLILLKIFGRRGALGGFLHDKLNFDIIFTWRAVLLALREHQAIGLHPEKIDSWIIGKNFTESLHAWNFSQVASQAELVIDACARILLKKPRQPLKEFWSNVEKKIQIIRDDGATGWRTHLSKRGVGFRLMLWIHKNGTVEFANVANKAECEIF